MPLRVDNIPFFLRPIYHSLSFLAAFFLYSLCVIIKWTCRIQYEGKENLLKDQNYIFCLWHQSLAGYFTVFLSHHGKHIWMNHPAWFMKPIHYWIRLIGVKELALGSAGNSGKEALKQVVDHLKTGYNTLITPDGPAGPPRFLKKGVILMGAESGIPVVPLKIIPSGFLLLPTWDKKRIPLPFSTIRVVFEKPIMVTDSYQEKTMREIELALEEKPDHGF